MLFTHPSSLRHVTPNGHPERIDRIKAVNQILGSPHFNDLVRREAPQGRDEDILRAHAYEHLERIRAMAPGPACTSNASPAASGMLPSSVRLEA